MLQLAFFVLLLNLTFAKSSLLDETIGAPALAGFGAQSNIANNPLQNTRKDVTPAVQADTQLNPVKPVVVLTLNKDAFSKENTEDAAQKQVGKKNDESQPPEKVHTPQVQSSNNKAVGTEQNENKNPNSKTSKASDTPKQSTDKTSNTSEKKDDAISVAILPNSKDDIIESGALLRGFYVFLGLSVITMVYFIFRSYRLRRGSQPSTTVKKYGITARRSDMEMRPLELEDEDDDTLFDIGNQNINR